MQYKPDTVEDCQSIACEDCIYYKKYDKTCEQLEGMYIHESECYNTDETEYDHDN